MIHHLESCLVCLRKKNGEIVGAGFLWSENKVITCAHVVNSALNRGLKSQIKPTETESVEISFPFLGSKPQPAFVEQWHPSGENGEGDIALLRLAQPPPPGAKAASYLTKAELLDERFEAYGYPAGNNVGAWAQGVIGYRRPNGSLQIQDTNAQGYRVQPGYSGGPLWGVTCHAVVGMVVSAELDPEAKVGFMLPIEYILSTCHLSAPVTEGQPVVDLMPPGYDYVPEWYIHRKRQEEVARILLQRPGQPVVLWGPDGYGKTWLLHHLLDVRTRERTTEGRTPEGRGPEEQVWQSAFIDLNDLLLSLPDETANELPDKTTNENFYLELARCLARAAAPDKAELLVREHWRSAGDPVSRVTNLLDALLKRDSGLFALAIDQADAVYQRPEQNSFFIMLNAWARKKDPAPWRQLRLLLTVSTTPTRLIDTKFPSPFNLSKAIPVGDFSFDQIWQLAARHGLRWRAAGSAGETSSSFSLSSNGGITHIAELSQQMSEVWGRIPPEVQEIWNVVGGHPYLVRQVLYYMAQSYELQPLLDESEPLEGSIFDFAYMSRWLEEIAQDETIRQALKCILRGDDASPIDAETRYRLLASGLVVEDGTSATGYRLRYPLYERYLRKLFR